MQKYDFNPSLKNDNLVIKAILKKLIGPIKFYSKSDNENFFRSIFKDISRFKDAIERQVL